MTADSLNDVTRRLLRTADPGWTSPSDADLLQCYLASRDEAAFEALIRRHGPMILALCRRVLRSEPDAEDAFQATFLVLARKASSVRQPEALSNWLYGVAHNVARRARSMNRRQRASDLAAVTQASSSGGEEVWQQVENVVDDELSRLPDKYRVPVVVCALDGCTIREAADRLGWRPGTVATRLARGRTLLARRLSRHGIAAPATLMTAGVGRSSTGLPADLVAATVRAGVHFAAGQVAATGQTARTVALADGTLRSMSRAKLPGLVAILLGVGLAVGAGLAVHRESADPTPASGRDQSKPPAAAKPDEPQSDEGARRATRVALAAHARAAAIDALPRFDYQVRYRHGVVDSMRATDATLERLTQGLTAPVLDKDWFGWWESGFSWDERRFLEETRPGDTVLGHNAHFWTPVEAWERSEAKDKSAIQFVRMAGSDRLWKGRVLFHYSYLRLTPHQFRWGRTVKLGNSMTMSFIPPDKGAWKHLGTEALGGEDCDVVDSAVRGQRLWVGQKSGHVRGALTYHLRDPAQPAAATPFHDTEVVRRIAGKTFASPQEFGDWLQRGANDDQLVRYMLAWWEYHPPTPTAIVEPNELIRFDDYREIAPGVWLPFREVRTFPHASEIVKGKHQLIRSELAVTEARTDRDLSERYARLLPKEGNPVQDQRFAAPVNYKYRADQTDDEIRKTADTEYQKQLKDQEFVKRLLEPIEAMVGKPAPALPAEGWVGGQRPDLAGKPYLLHFWATWCGPCKNDHPLLKSLAEEGVVVVGMHPPGTPAADVEKAVRAHGLTWPTLVAPGEDRGGGVAEIAGYRAGVFPYAVLVDGRGRVAAHGSLQALVEKVGAGAMVPPRKDSAGKP